MKTTITIGDRIRDVFVRNQSQLATLGYFLGTAYTAATILYLLTMFIGIEMPESPISWYINNACGGCTENGLTVTMGLLLLCIVLSCYPMMVFRKFCQRHMAEE